MRLGCIVLAHRDATALSALVRRLAHPNIRLYVHLDKATPEEPFRRALGDIDPAPVWLPRHRSRWGGFEMVEATLGGLRRGFLDGCDYFVLISGQDLPLESADQLVDRFAAAPERSYVESFSLPDARWRYNGRVRTDFYTFTVRNRRETCIPRGEAATFSLKGRVLNSMLQLRTLSMPKRRFPANVRAHGGSQWWNLSRAAVDHVLSFIEANPEYHQYHRFTLAPDELYFQSVLLGTHFAQDHDIVNDSLRFMIWEPGSSHPRVLRMGDLSSVRTSGKPFGRKFDSLVDAEVVRALSGDNHA